jgi:hypothetical protein
MEDVIVNVLGPLMPFSVARAFRTTCKKWKDLIKGHTYKPLQRNLQMLRNLERYNLTFNIEIKDYVQGEADINDLNVKRLRLSNVFSGLSFYDICYLELECLTIIKTKLERIEFSSLKVLWLQGTMCTKTFNLPNLEALVLVDIPTSKKVIDKITGGVDLLKHAYVVYTKSVTRDKKTIMDLNELDGSQYFDYSFQESQSVLSGRIYGKCLRIKNSYT